MLFISDNAHLEREHLIDSCLPSHIDLSLLACIQELPGEIALCKVNPSVKSVDFLPDSLDPLRKELGRLRSCFQALLYFCQIPAVRILLNRLLILGNSSG